MSVCDIWSFCDLLTWLSHGSLCSGFSLWTRHTRLALKHTPIWDNMTFPSMTFCSYSHFSVSKRQNFGRTAPCLRYMCSKRGLNAFVCLFVCVCARVWACYTVPGVLWVLYSPLNIDNIKMYCEVLIKQGMSMEDGRILEFHYFKQHMQTIKLCISCFTVPFMTDVCRTFSPLAPVMCSVMSTWGVKGKSVWFSLKSCVFYPLTHLDF